MNTYLTEYERDGKRWDGGNIEADSFEEAERLAPAGVRVVGCLVFECDLSELGELGMFLFSTKNRLGIIL